MNFIDRAVSILFVQIKVIPVDWLSVHSIE